MPSRTARQRMLMPFFLHPPPIVMHLTWMVRSKTWFVCKQYMILDIIVRSTAVSEGSKNVGDQAYFELRSNFQFWNILILTVQSIFRKLLKLDQILQRNISQIFWVSVKLQQEFSKIPIKTVKSRQTSVKSKHQKRRKWIFILNKLQPSRKSL